MLISLIRLLIDFGLVVLIWIIQIIVYPSFLFYDKESLINWHKKYIILISYIVGPLMIFELGISIYQIITFFSLYHCISVLIILMIWILTFKEFVPKHSAISEGKISKQLLNSLVQKNWYRTMLWTLLFIYSFFEII